VSDRREESETSGREGSGDIGRVCRTFKSGVRLGGDP